MKQVQNAVGLNYKIPDKQVRMLQGLNSKNLNPHRLALDDPSNLLISKEKGQDANCTTSNKKRAEALHSNHQC